MCVGVCVVRRKEGGREREREKKNCSGILYIDQMNKELKPFSQQTFFSLFLSIESFDNATIKVNDLYSLYFSHTFPFTLPTYILHSIRRHPLHFVAFHLRQQNAAVENLLGGISISKLI